MIGKDAVLFGTTVRVEGEVGRDLKMSADDSYIEGQIGRNAEIKSAKHTRVAPEAKITGHLFNASVTKDIAESVIAGEFKHEELSKGGAKISGWRRLSGGVMWALSIGLLVVVVTMLRPKRLKDFSREQFKLINIFYIGIGYAVLIGLPIGAILVAMTAVGMPLAILTAAVWLAVLILALPLAIYYVSNNIAALFNKKNELLAALSGVLAYAVINSVPTLAVILNLALVGLGAGLFVKLLIGGLKLANKEKKK